jgi:hypothetical protein
VPDAGLVTVLDAFGHHVYAGEVVGRVAINLAAILGYVGYGGVELL